MAAAAAEETAAGKTAMVVGIDDSEHSFYALQWTLLHFFSGPGLNPPFKLVVVYAKPTATSFVGFPGPSSADVLRFLESDLNRIAARVMEKAKELCTANSVVLLANFLLI